MTQRGTRSVHWRDLAIGLGQLLAYLRGASRYRAVSMPSRKGRWAGILLANAGVFTATRNAAFDAWRRIAGYLMQAFSVEAAQPLPEALTRAQVYRALMQLNDPPA